MMMRTRNMETAIQQAKEWGVAWGLCIVDGLYIVGEIDRLKDLPVVISAECEEAELCS